MRARLETHEHLDADSPFPRGVSYFAEWGEGRWLVTLALTEDRRPHVVQWFDMASQPQIDDRCRTLKFSPGRSVLGRRGYRVSSEVFREGWVDPHRQSRGFIRAGELRPMMVPDGADALPVLAETAAQLFSRFGGWASAPVIPVGDDDA
jgi:hypothetical protein